MLGTTTNLGHNASQLTLGLDVLFPYALNAAVHCLNLTRGATIATLSEAVRNSIRTLTMVLVRLRTPHDGQPLGDVHAQAR